MTGYMVEHYVLHPQLGVVVTTEWRQAGRSRVGLLEARVDGLHLRHGQLGAVVPVALLCPLVPLVLQAAVCTLLSPTQPQC